VTSPYAHCERLTAFYTIVLKLWTRYARLYPQVSKNNIKNTQTKFMLWCKILNKLCLTQAYTFNTNFEKILNYCVWS